MLPLPWFVLLNYSKHHRLSHFHSTHPRSFTHNPAVGPRTLIDRRCAQPPAPQTYMEIQCTGIWVRRDKQTVLHKQEMYFQDVWCLFWGLWECRVETLTPSTSWIPQAQYAYARISRHQAFVYICTYTQLALFPDLEKFRGLKCSRLHLEIFKEPKIITSKTSFTIH